ncbi:MAG: TetR/AcrR family transcriptional regulator [Rhodoferax sp.]|nr:TetR/AcrR family transcriptional regulator [Rhodoferax sp.]
MRKTTKDYHHGNLRNALLGAAISHIEEAGEVSFTLRDLAKKLGVSSAAPFRHFPSKRALLAAIAESGYEQLGDVYAELDSSFPNDPGECFKRKGVAYVQFAITHKAYYLAMYHPELNDKSEFPALKAAGARVFVSMLATVEACREKNLLSNFSAEQITLTIWSVTHGLADLLINGQLAELGIASTEQAAIQAMEAVSMVVGAGLQKNPKQP